MTPKKDNIKKLFNEISEGYDLFNHVTTLNIDKRWRKKAIRRAVDRTNPQEILDVACGTGDFTIAIAKAACPKSRVTGVDIAADMLARLRKKAREAHVEKMIRVETGDAEALRFADATFDVVCIAFGVRNFENREKGLREMLRVLKPDGKLVLLELSVPSNFVARWLFKFYLVHILPWIGGALTGNKASYRYLAASVRAFPGPDTFKQILKNSGFRHIRQKPLFFGVCRLYTAKK
jgi:demethylmenaquinone methyltransferase/2-methoxy-6-polyprenyl-1,4-benzoquinol methylase